MPGRLVLPVPLQIKGLKPAAPTPRENISYSALSASGFVPSASALISSRKPAGLTPPDHSLPCKASVRIRIFGSCLIYGRFQRHLGSRNPFPHCSIILWSGVRTTLHPCFFSHLVQVPSWNCSKSQSHNSTVKGNDTGQRGQWSLT